MVDVRKNGTKYVGNWEDGKQHGMGTLIKNGIAKQYMWNKGQKISKETPVSSAR